MQLIATYLAESEQRIEEPSVQHDVCSSGNVLIGREYVLRVVRMTASAFSTTSALDIMRIRLIRA